MFGGTETMSGQFFTVHSMHCIGWVIYALLIETSISSLSRLLCVRVDIVPIQNSGNANIYWPTAMEGRQRLHMGVVKLTIWTKLEETPKAGSEGVHLDSHYAWWRRPEQQQRKHKSCGKWLIPQIFIICTLKTTNKLCCTIVTAELRDPSRR